MGDPFKPASNGGTFDTIVGRNTVNPGYENGTGGDASIGTDGTVSAIRARINTAIVTGVGTSADSVAFETALTKLVQTQKRVIETDPTLGSDALVLAYTDYGLDNDVFVVSAPPGTVLPPAVDTTLTGDWTLLSSAIAAIGTVGTNAALISALTSLATKDFTLSKRLNAVVEVEFRLARPNESAVTAPVASGAVLAFRPDYNRIVHSAVDSDNNYKITAAGIAYQLAAASAAAVAANTLEYRYVLRVSKAR